MTRAWHPVALAGLLAAAPVAAVEYLGVEAAQKLAFPDATSFAPVALALDAEARAKLAAVARPPGVRDPKVWRALAGNRQLQATVLNYWDRAHRARMFSLRLRPKPVNSTKEHMQMVERLRAGDAEGCVRVTRAHRERARLELVAIFERFKLAQM